ncbi:MAG: N-acetylmuramoyl-L-alanine amidase [Chitinispirillia bacterium]|nr:N-acetylmuramoyl-L-alanine amidase [Chitinispirillia bacterium]MCL2268306.1 N-acetylmuramoyl-L-alanine amidase [Chitinispirillia bacterium]
MRAWHAGASIMPEPDNRKGANEFAIGIELMATAKSGFTDAQYNSLAELCKDIEKRRSKKMTYVGHDQIAGKRAVDMKLRADAKPDPGPLFDWGRFMGGLRK